MKLKTGQTLYFDAGIAIFPAIITKMGVKYFYVSKDNDTPYGKHNLRSIESRYPTWKEQLYFSEEAILTVREYHVLIQNIKNSVGGHIDRKLSLQQLRDINSIIKNEPTNRNI